MFPMVVYTRSILLLAYPAVVYSGSDIGLLGSSVPNGCAHKIYITASVANNSNFFLQRTQSLITQGSMHSMVVHSISVPFTAYSTGLYPGHCETITGTARCYAHNQVNSPLQLSSNVQKKNKKKGSKTRHKSCYFINITTKYIL